MFETWIARSIGFRPLTTERVGSWSLSTIVLNYWLAINSALIATTDSSMATISCVVCPSDHQLHWLPTASHIVGVQEDPIGDVLAQHHLKPPDVASATWLPPVLLDGQRHVQRSLKFPRQKHVLLLPQFGDFDETWSQRMEFPHTRIIMGYDGYWIRIPLKKGKWTLCLFVFQSFVENMD